MQLNYFDWRYFLRKSKLFQGLTVSPQVKKSAAAYPYSGQVWMQRLLSWMMTTLDTPWGSKKWEFVDRIVAPDTLAASVIACSKALLSSSAFLSH